MYLILAKTTKHFGADQLFPLLKYIAYDEQIIACHFSYHTLYQPLFIKHPLSLSALELRS